MFSGRRGFLEFFIGLECVYFCREIEFINISRVARGVRWVEEG